MHSYKCYRTSTVKSVHHHAGIHYKGTRRADQGGAEPTKETRCEHAMVDLWACVVLCGVVWWVWLDLFWLDWVELGWVALHYTHKTKTQKPPKKHVVNTRR